MSDASGASRVRSMQDASGQWYVRIRRSCSHSIVSPARFANERRAIEHGEYLLRRSRCLTCALEERNT